MDDAAAVRGPPGRDGQLSVLYFAEASWHTDDGIGVRGVKFAAYFDELTAGNGALRLVPGSHHPEQNARLAAYRDRQLPIRTDAEAAAYQASIPGYVAGTSPGDVIAFDLHTWQPAAAAGTGWPGRRSTSAAPKQVPNASGRCGRCTTASSRRSAASTGTATPSGGTGSPTPPRIRAAAA